jgi:hypothetical protein
MINGAATSENIRSAISDLFWRSEEKEAIGLFYFAGHGAHDHLDNGYLLPHDADIDAPFVKGISLQDLKNLFLASRISTTAIMILDCCYSGIATRARSGPDKRDLIKRFDDVVGPQSTGSGRFVLASAGADEKAREGEAIHADGDKHVHGKYSFHLIEALRGVAGGDSGQVSLGEVIRHIGKMFPTPISATGIDMDGIWLTKIPQKLKDILGQSYDRIDRYISNNNLQDLLFAIEEVIDLQGRGIGEREKLTSYLEQIDYLIASSYQARCSNWWYNLRADLYRFPNIDRSRLKVLEDLVLDLTVKNYRDHDKITRGFLGVALEAADKGRDHRSVARYLRDESPAPRIGAENIIARPAEAT